MNRTKVPDLKWLCLEYLLDYSVVDLKEGNINKVVKKFDEIPFDIRKGLLKLWLQNDILYDGSIELFLKTIEESKYFEASRSSLNSSGLDRIIEACPSIVYLDISYCVELETITLSKLCELQYLSCLNVEGCNNYSDDNLLSLAGLKQLSYLNIKQCNCVNYDTIIKFLKNLKEIETIEFDQKMPTILSSSSDDDAYAHILGYDYSDSDDFDI